VTTTNPRTGRRVTTPFSVTQSYCAPHVGR
jgi:hypothetical protein